jgi:hypothetical protein
LDTSVVVEIRQRLALYGHAADAADRTLLAQVFSTDAIFDADLVEGESTKVSMQSFSGLNSASHHTRSTT